jgi:hypothetical protein
MAKLEYNKTTDGPIVIRNGANHYRLIGLELTRVAGGRIAPTLIGVEADGVADHIIVDRSWLHGTAQDETQLGVSLDGTNYVAVIDSYFSDFHCTAGTGTCSDAHAVAGGIVNLRRHGECAERIGASHTQQIHVALRRRQRIGRIGQRGRKLTVQG